ncbi:replication protein A 14 kDa subunit-like [Argopecten irradians]|uniref:replication protein A 14 kDa subunit-like n=1 Tax=Argopecten irradians TaxID=31199 RepID=UPI00371F6FD0
MEDFSKPRVNGAMLPSYQGKVVCLLGMAKDVDQNGQAFTLTTSDGQDIRISMQEPLSEYVAGLTEVEGQVQSNKGIMCQNYITFPQETTDAFDMKMYNDAVELSARFSNHYVVGVQG